MKIKKEILDELIRDYRNPGDLSGEDGLLKQLTKALLERTMEAEPKINLHKNSDSP